MSGGAGEHTPGLFSRKTNPEDLLCTVYARLSSGQASIRNNFRGIQDWDREYVEFSGYFGTHGPDVFAVAPDLLAACEAAIDVGIVPKSSAVDGGAVRHSRQIVVADQIRAAIAKARGAA